jgi:glycosyltransferase involved in cell wall biosynthesis
MKKIFLETAKLSNLNSGLGQFCFHLGKELLAQKADSLEFDFYVPKKSKGILGSANYVIQSDLHKFFPKKSGNYSLWHCMHQDSPYLPADKNLPLMLTVHDLNIIHRYTGNKLKRKLENIQKKIDRATVITAISKFAAQEVKTHLNTGNKPLHVIYNGNALVKHENENRPAFVPEGKFLFSMGIIQPKKNFHVLIPLLEKQKEYKFVLAGNDKDHYATEIKDLAMRYGVIDRLILPGKISEEEKYWLYKNCDAFLFPSLTEGFGLPVVEAMSLGKPVFLNQASSLPEVGGEEAFYWNDFDPVEMNEVFTNGMNTYANDPLKKERIIKWSAQFSWTNAAKQYISLYLEHSC